MKKIWDFIFRAYRPDLIYIRDLLCWTVPVKIIKILISPNQDHYFKAQPGKLKESLFKVQTALHGELTPLHSSVHQTHTEVSANVANHIIKQYPKKHLPKKLEQSLFTWSVCTMYNAMLFVQYLYRTCTKLISWKEKDAIGEKNKKQNKQALNVFISYHATSVVFSEPQCSNYCIH